MVGVASPPWTHNPTVTLVNGIYVLYHLGVGRPNGHPHTNCSGGCTRGPGTATLDAEAAFSPSNGTITPAVRFFF